MQIIGKAFEPAEGNSRAACVDLDTMVIAIVTKGDDADNTIASFNDSVANLSRDVWDIGAEIWKGIDTDSPVMMFCRSKTSDESYNWRKVFYSNLDEVSGSYPDEPYALRSSMMGFYTDIKLLRPELMDATDFLRDDKFNFYSGRNFILLSTASYERARDWNNYNDSALRTVTALCGDNPEDNWDAAGEVLRTSIAPDAAYVVIVNADKCRDRAFWNVPEGEPSGHRIKIDWSKEGWELSGPEYNENSSDVVQAKTGVLEYEHFCGLCITEINDSSITFRYKDKKFVLSPGESFKLFENDSYEDSQGVEHYDINYELIISRI